MNQIRWLFGIVVAMLSIAALSACGDTSGGPGHGGRMERTVTIEQANAKLEQHLERSQALFPDSVSFEEFAKYENSPCEDPGESGPKGREFASRIYQVKGFPAEQIKEQFAQIKQWWTSNGYRVVFEDEELLSVENKEDEHGLGLRTNQNGELFLLGDSPCVWPNGTPQPEEE